MKTPHERALRDIGEVFGDRLKRAEPAPPEVSDAGDALSSVSPLSVEEVTLLAEVAGRYSVPLVALGGGTASKADVEGGSILIQFDLMRGLRLPEHEEPWVEAEPGASWLQLDDSLRTRACGLAVYPTSAPRATVGGWLAMDGLGVGSFECGWLSENVLSARVVLPGGELVEVSGEEVRSFVEPGAAGIIVSSKLRTRQAYADVPFGAAFGSADDLTGAVAGIVEVGLPLWHLAFLNPGMAHARNLGETFCFSGPIRQNGREKSRAASKASSGPLGAAPSPQLKPTVRGGRGSFRSRPLFYPHGFLLYPAIWSRWWTSLRSLARWRTVPGSPPSRAPSPGLERCCS